MSKQVHRSVGSSAARLSGSSKEATHTLAYQLDGVPYAVQAKLVEPERPVPLHLAQFLPAVQCNDGDPVDASDQLTTDQVFGGRGMTLEQLVEHVDAHPDWAQSTSLTDAAKGWIQQQIDFVNQARDVVLCGCGDMSVVALRDAPLDEENRRSLLAYCAAVRRDHPTVLIDPTNRTELAIKLGGAIGPLEAAISGVILREAVSEISLEDLVDEGHLEDFIHYVQDCSPVLSARGGTEVNSYLALWAEGVDPASYKDSLPQIRNYHHFERQALDRVGKNYRNGNRSNLPLTLILVASVDYNGAFHRDATLTDVIADARSFSLVVEGPESLEQYSSQLGGIAQEYGRDGQIEQVIIAGHGNTRAIQMAGTVGENEGQLTTTEDRLTLDDNEYGSAARTESFFQELLRHMPSGEGAQGRIVLHACLTNSNVIGADLSPDDPGLAATQIRDALAQNPNMVRYLTELAASQGDIQVLGANAATFDTRLLDPDTGQLTLTSQSDPFVTREKIDYVRSGIEPTGVMRAVVECLADENTAPDCIEAMNDRVTQGASNWWGTIIVTLFQIILERHLDNLQMVNQLAGTALPLLRLSSESSTRRSNGFVSSFSQVLPPTEIGAIFGSMSAHDNWEGHVPVVAYQAWLAHRSDKIGDFIGCFSTEDLTCRDAIEHVDIPFLAPWLSLILPASAAVSPAEGHLVVALLAVIHQMSNPPEAAVTFLRGTLDGQQAFPGSLGINSLLEGLRTDAEILRAIGPSPA
ncbi:MAG: hypothetical protein JW797_20440 [Bradymonadales bacterium]|nr:hypothetical protein [Bradymonadales bacterium]